MFLISGWLMFMTLLDINLLHRLSGFHQGLFLSYTVGLVLMLVLCVGCYGHLVCEINLQLNEFCRSHSSDNF